MLLSIDNKNFSDLTLEKIENEVENILTERYATLKEFF